MVREVEPETSKASVLCPSSFLLPSATSTVTPETVKAALLATENPWTGWFCVERGKSKVSEQSGDSAKLLDCRAESLPPRRTHEEVDVAHRTTELDLEHGPGLRAASVASL